MDNMVETIWKYEIEVNDSISIEMPKGARGIHVGVQLDDFNGKEKVCLWAVVNPKNIIETRRFVVRGTGHSFKGEEGEHLGTFMLYEGALVFHLFEYQEPTDD